MIIFMHLLSYVHVYLERKFQRLKKGNQERREERTALSPMGPGGGTKQWCEERKSSQPIKESSQHIMCLFQNQTISDKYLLPTPAGKREGGTEVPSVVWRIVFHLWKLPWRDACSTLSLLSGPLLQKEAPNYFFHASSWGQEGNRKFWKLQDK